MVINKPLTPEDVKNILAGIEKMLTEPNQSCVIHLERGIIWYDDYVTGFRQARPTSGRTIKIEIDGGAVERDETFEEKRVRLLKD